MLCSIWGFDLKSIKPFSIEQQQVTNSHGLLIYTKIHFIGGCALGETSRLYQFQNKKNDASFILDIKSRATFPCMLDGTKVGVRRREDVHFLEIIQPKI